MNNSLEQPNALPSVETRTTSTVVEIPPTQLQVIQWEIEAWTAKNFPNSRPHEPLIGVTEELGELCHAHLKGEQSIRHSAEEIHSMKIDAIGDLVIYLCHYCNHQKIDLSSALETTWEKVKARDWQAHPLDADKHL